MTIPPYFAEQPAPANPLDDPYIESLNLSIEERIGLQSEVDGLRTDSLDLIIARIERGQRLIRIKERIGHGNRKNAASGWLDWIVRSDVGFDSVRSAERAMALAEALYSRRDELRQLTSLTKITALYEITRDGYERVLDTAISLMKSGVVVERKMAEMLTRIQDESPDLITAIESGEMGVKAAYETMIARRYAPRVAEIVERHEVTNVPLIAALQSAPKALLDEIGATGAIYNPNLQQQVPLKEATVSDYAAWQQMEQVEAMERQRAHLQAWRNARPPQLAKVRGKPADVIAEIQKTLADGDAEYLVLIYPAPAIGAPEPEPTAEDVNQ